MIRSPEKSPNAKVIDPFSLSPNVIEIDLDTLASNFHDLSRHATPAKVMCVIKANAYGHGLVECARHLEKIGASYFGVAQLQEGVELRQAGIQTPILVFGGILNDQIEHFINFDLDLTASSVEKLRAIDAAAKKLQKKARAQLKIDTGMGRIGVKAERTDQLFREAMHADSCIVTGVYSHFARADEEDPSYTQEQLEKFLQAVRFFPEHGYPMPLRHIANSAAMIRSKDCHLDFVRPGLALYGIYPAEFLKQTSVNLKPIQTLKSKVVYFKLVSAGQGVSYGHTWTAPVDTSVVTVPLGYGDGYMRCLSNRAEVLLRGKRYRTVGNICMDQLMVAIGDDEAVNGDEVVLIGVQGDQRITVEELAQQANTIPYEILTNLNLRIPRRYRIVGV